MPSPLPASPQGGCISKLERFFQDHLLIIGAVGIGIACVQVRATGPQGAQGWGCWGALQACDNIGLGLAWTGHRHDRDVLPVQEPEAGALLRLRHPVPSPHLLSYTAERRGPPVPSSQGAQVPFAAHQSPGLLCRAAPSPSGKLTETHPELPRYLGGAQVPTLVPGPDPPRLPGERLADPG